MIIDRIENAKLYASLSPDIAAGLAYLENCPDEATPRTNITPTATAAVNIYTASPDGTRKWEAHEHLIDIHYVKSGSERIRWANRGDLQYVGKEPDKDVLRFTGEGTDFILTDGMFCILFPDDAHTTKLAAEMDGPITKAILKISI